MASLEERLAQMKSGGAASPSPIASQPTTQNSGNLTDRLAAMKSSASPAPAVQTPKPEEVVTEKKDDDRNLWEKTMDFLGFTTGKAAAGVAEGAEGIVNTVGYYPQLVQKSAMQQAAGGAAMAAAFSKDPLVDEYAKKQQTAAQEDINKEMKTIANFGDKATAKVEEKYADVPLSKATRFVGDVAQGVGGMATTILGNIVVPGLGTAAMVASAFGNSVQEAQKQGAGAGEAAVYGLANSAIELATEKVFGGMKINGKEIFGTGLLDKAKDVLVKKASNGAARASLNTAFSFIGEGLEEFAAEYGQSLANRLTINTEDREWSDVRKDAFRSALIGGTIGGLLNVGSSIEAGKSVTIKEAADIAATEAAKEINETVATQGEISPSDGVSSQPATDTNAAENTGRGNQGMPGFETGENAAEASAELPDFGTGGARIDTVATEQPFKMAKTKDAATERSNWMSEDLRKELAPEDHRVISEKESLDYAQNYFAYDKDGNLDYEKSVQDLIDVPNWTGREADAAMLLVKEAEKRGDMDTVRSLNRLRRATTSEGARTLQATKKWVSESGDNIVDEASKAVDAAVESGAISGEKANETLTKVSKLAKEFDAVAKDGTPSADESANGSPAEAVVKRARKTAAQKIAEDTPEEIKPKKKRSSNRRPKGKGDKQQISEPFTFEYADAVGEAVAKGIAKKVEPVPEKTFLQQMTSVLRRFASEKLPKQKVESLTPIELMRDYIQNKEFYAKAWEMAQQSIRDGKSVDPALDAFINSGIAVDANADNMNTIFMRALVASAAEIGETKNQIAIQNALGIHGMDRLIANTLIHKTEAEGEMAQTIKDAASHYVNNVIAGSKIDVEKTIDAKVKAALKDIKLTLSQLAVYSDTTKATVRAHVIKTLKDKYGFNGADAGDVADIVGNHYDALVKQAVDNKLEQMLKVATPGKPKTYLEKIREAINVGGFDSDKFAAAFNEKFLGEGADMLNADMMREVFNATKAKQYADIIRRTAKMRHTTGLLSKDLSSNLDGALERIVKRGDIEFLRTLAANGIVNIATDAKKVTASEAAKTIRRQSMLSKAATTMRNFVSNGSFSGVDTFARDISVPLDFLLSKLTKTRSIAIDKNLLSKKAREGVLEAMDKSLLEVGLDVDASGERGAYEQTGNRTFKMSGGVFSRLMSSWEKWEGYALVTADAAAKGGTEAEIARGLRKLYANGKLKIPAGVAPAEYIADMAKQEALYRTFQDDTKLSAAAMGLRDVANKAIHIGELGLGDVILPFAKTPANLATRALEYSPAGLAKAVAYDIPSVLIKAKKGTLTAAEQAQAVQNIGRGVTGSALIAGFAALSAKELIKTIGDGGDDDDKDKTAFEKMAGQNGTQWNLDATMRWFNGESTEWQDGDTLMSISFLEPFNAMMTTGALIVEDWQNEDLSGWEKMWASAKKSPEGAYRSISQLPMFESFRDFAQNMEYSDKENGWLRFADAAASYGADQVTSFIPNAVKGIAQGTDPIQRNAYTADTLVGQTWDNVKASLPGLRQTVDAKVDSYGNPMETEGGVLGFLNSNILPGQITHYKEQTGQSVIDYLYEITGNAGVYPDRKAPNKIDTTIGGKTYNVELDGDAKQEYLQTAGQAHEELLAAIEADPEFQNLTTEQQVEIVNAARLRAQQEAKLDVFHANGINPKQSKVDKVKEQMSPSEYINWLIADTKAVTPDGYAEGSTPQWQQFEIVLSLPDSLAVDMIIAQGGDTGRRISAAVDNGISVQRAVEYYRATSERNAEGKSPTKGEVNQRLAAAGFTADERRIMKRAFELTFK